MEIEDNAKSIVGVTWFSISLGGLIGFNTPAWISFTYKEAMSFVEFELAVLAGIFFIFVIGTVIEILKHLLGYDDSQEEDDIEDFTPIQQHIVTGLFFIVGPFSVGYLQGQLARIISFKHSSVLLQSMFVNGILLGLCFTCAIVVYFEELRSFDSYEVLKNFFE